MNKILLALLVVSGCAMGAPPGFSRGDTWTFPLVDPLADDRLVTPVYIAGHGPYLFAIDPDAPITVVDNEVIAAVGVRSRQGARVVDEHDTSHATFYAQVTDVQIGDLGITLWTVRLSQNGAFNTERRRISGVLGRDIIADSLVFGFDRERGVAWLKTQEAFHAPDGAQVIDYFKGTTHRPDLVVRRLVNTTVDGASYDLHLDLGDVPSQLRQEHWGEARLSPVTWKMTIVDEAGTRRQITTDGIADRVTAGRVTREHIGFVPYDDRRWDFGQLEGTLGLDFFRPFSVAVNWHEEQFYLTPRVDSAANTAVRLARWGTAFPSQCPTPGCVALEIIPASPESPAAVQVTRDPAASGANLEVVFGAKTATGAPLPSLYLSMPKAVDQARLALDASYEQATLSVVDVSPFPYACDGCIVADAALPP